MAALTRAVPIRAVLSEHLHAATADVKRSLAWLSDVRSLKQRRAAQRIAIQVSMDRTIQTRVLAMERRAQTRAGEALTNKIPRASRILATIASGTKILNGIHLAVSRGAKTISNATDPLLRASV